ncbi:MAG: adenosylcobinamide-GDP ribazoletransferase [Coriobacteriia bacterium]|nr:adenosylcobinamide-GDP ribazoletransferase [Coriobacteriia bacterium]
MTDDTGKRPVLRDARLALALLTVVPSGVLWPERERTGVAAWFAAVGLVFGWVAYSFAAAVPVSVAQSVGGLMGALMVLAGALVTRLLHYDGLADVADAWWGGDSAERRLAIMADSRTGAFGATGVALVVIVQVTAASSLLATSSAALLIAPVVGRLAATIAAWIGEPARDGGLGRSVMGRPRLSEVAIALAVCVLTAGGAYAIQGVIGLILMGAGMASALVVPHYIAKRVGGVTGDVMGASIIVVGTLILVAGALVNGVFG